MFFLELKNHTHFLLAATIFFFFFCNLSNLRKFIISFFYCKLNLTWIATHTHKQLQNKLQQQKTSIIPTMYNINFVYVCLFERLCICVCVSVQRVATGLKTTMQKMQLTNSFIVLIVRAMFIMLPVAAYILIQSERARELPKK